MIYNQIIYCKTFTQQLFIQKNTSQQTRAGSRNNHSTPLRKSAICQTIFSYCSFNTWKTILGNIRDFSHLMSFTKQLRNWLFEKAKKVNVECGGWCDGC